MFNSKIKNFMTAGVVVASVGFPAGAQAMPPLLDQSGADASSVAQIAPPVQSLENSGQSAFEWGDAGIGAAGTIVLVGAGVAASGLVRRRRTHDTVIG